MSDSAHLLILFAACRATGCREALSTLRLPNLDRQLSRLSPVRELPGSGEELSMPHERAIALENALGERDGALPLAAWQRTGMGLETGNAAWAWVTPCHWNVGMGQVSMGHPQALQLTDGDSQALLAAMQPYFEQDGIHLAYDSPTRWFASGELFRDLPTASLDRVAGHVIDAWMPRGHEARPLRRLQQEMQMLLYTHPVNDERIRAGLPPVNSFWVSGTGALPESASPAKPTNLRVVDALCDSAMRQDWTAWARAWEHLDTTELARESVGLTLCGEHAARTWAPRDDGLWRRMTRGLRRVRATEILETL